MPLVEELFDRPQANGSKVEKFWCVSIWYLALIIRMLRLLSQSIARAEDYFSIEFVGFFFSRNDDHRHFRVLTNAMMMYHTEIYPHQARELVLQMVCGPCGPCLSLGSRFCKAVVMPSQPGRWSTGVRFFPSCAMSLTANLRRPRMRSKYGSPVCLFPHDAACHWYC